MIIIIIVTLILCFHFSMFGEGTLEGATYNIITWNPRWRLATDFLRGASADFLRLHVACLNDHRCHRFRFSTRFQKFTRSSGRVGWSILVANLATNFQDLVANAGNLGALAPVLGAILGPALPSWTKFSRGVGGCPKWNSLRGRGMDIFWNHTICESPGNAPAKC